MSFHHQQKIHHQFIEVNDKHYIVLPKIIRESYFVKCIKTKEKLELTNEIWFYGNEENIKEQITKYIELKKVLSKKNIVIYIKNYY